MRLAKLQKRAARIILKADYNATSSGMFQELGLSMIPNRHSYNKEVLTYKKGKRKVQEVPQSQVAAHPRHEEEEETDKTKKKKKKKKKTQIEQMYEKH